MQEHLLDAEEIPGCLGGVRAHPRVRCLAEWRVEEESEYHDERDEAECHGDLAHQQVRQRENVFGRLLGLRIDCPRIHYAVRFAHSPEMPGEKEDEHDRYDRGVERVKVDQGSLVDLRSAPDHLSQPLAEERDVGDHSRADRDRPVRELVPRQQVTGEVRSDDAEQEDQADDPVELARLVVTAGEIDAQQVKEDD